MSTSVRFRTIIRARNVKTVCCIKAKPRSHISGPRSEFLALGLRLLIPYHWICFAVLSLMSFVLCSGFQFLGPRIQVLGPGLQVPGP